MWDDVQAEISAISALGSHKNVQNILHVEKCSMNKLIASPYCKYGDLHKALFSHILISKREDYPRPVLHATLMRMCRQIAEGLNHLHRKGYAHRDVKPENILVEVDETTGRVNCKLADFGYAIALWKNSTTKTDESHFPELRRAVSGRHGTTGYQAYELLVAREAPEGLVMTNRQLQSCDVFGLGCVYFFILSKGSHPFGHEEMRRDGRILGRNKPEWSRLEKSLG